MANNKILQLQQIPVIIARSQDIIYSDCDATTVFQGATGTDKRQMKEIQLVASDHFLLREESAGELLIIVGRGLQLIREVVKRGHQRMCRRVLQRLVLVRLDHVLCL